MQFLRWGGTGWAHSQPAHTDGQAEKREAWSISRHLQAWRWDTAYISPVRSWLRAPSYVPAWPADKGDASQSAASTVPSTHSQQACLVRPLPESRQTSMHQTASLAQQQVFLPLRRIKASKFLPTNRTAAPERSTRPPRGHESPVLLRGSVVQSSQLPPRRRGNTGQARPCGIPRGHDTSQLYSKGASLSKLNVSPNQMKRAKRSEMVLIIQRLQNKAACPEAFSFP